MVRLPGGTMISGQFRLQRSLAERATSSVYVADQLSVGRQRALKIMDPTVARDPRVRERFVREAQAAARVESAHIVEVVAIGVDEAIGAPWVAMELLEGEDLAQRIAREGPQSRSSVQDILEQVCHALSAVHASGIAHGDLRPENVFISHTRGQSTVKLLGLGLASAVAEARRTVDASALAGSPAWMAPEQIQGRAATAASDVWSLGLLSFYMLTGQLFWRAPPNVAWQLVGEVLSAPMPTASQRARELGVGGRVPATLDDWFSACVAREPRQRFVDARIAWATMASWIATLPSAVGPEAAVTGLAPGPTVMMTPDVEAALAAQDASRTSAAPEIAPPRLGTGTHVFPDDIPFDVPKPKRATGTAMMPDDLADDQAQAKPPVIPVEAVAVPRGGAHARSRPPTHSNTPLLIGAVVVLGIGAVVAVRTLSGALSGESSAAPAASGEPAPSATDPKPANPFVKLDPTSASWLLGVESDTVPIHVRGLRPARKVSVPRAAYELQQHEVTWGELDPWLEADAAHAFSPPPKVPSDRAKRARLPATGVPWATALDYCKAQGGALPSEAQWEYAARGTERRAFPWGDEPLDPQRTHAFQGADALVRPVGTSDQDWTVGAKGHTSSDLAGNAQEWTADLYTDDLPDQGDAWAQGASNVFRVVRGLPLLEDPSTMAKLSIAWREPVCAPRACSPPKPGEKGKSDDGFVLARVSFAAPSGASGVSKPTFRSMLVAEETRAAFTKCHVELSPAFVTVEYARTKGSAVCVWLEDGSAEDSENCADGTPGYGWRSGSSVKTKVNALGPANDSQATCVRRVITELLDPLPKAGAAPQKPKWPEEADAWTASVHIAWMQSAGVPRALSSIGFRCARSR